jgi:hypothetical protein
MSLQDKLVKVMAAVGAIGKDRTNSFHGYSYTSADAVMNKVRKALTTHDVCLSTEAELLEFTNGFAVVRITLTFNHGEESMSAQGIGQGYDKGDKAVMKAMTAAQKYAYATAFCISWGDDPEADAETDRRYHHHYQEEEASEREAKKREESGEEL